MLKEYTKVGRVGFPDLRMEIGDPTMKSDCGHVVLWCCVEGGWLIPFSFFLAFWPIVLFNALPLLSFSSQTLWISDVVDCC